MSYVFEDKTKFVLHPMEGLRNVFFAATKEVSRNPNGDMPKGPVTLHPSLAKLMPKIAKKRPGWVFRSVQNTFPHDHENEIRVYRLEIFHDGEHLGRLEWDAMRGGRYELDSPALKAKRERGYATYTKNEQRALSLLMNAYHRKTPRQVADETKDIVRNLYYREQQNRQALFQPKDYALLDAARKYVLDNFEAFVASRPENASLSDYPDLRDAYRRASAELSAFSSGAPNGPPSLVAVKQETNWLLYDPHKVGEMRIFTDANMPPEIRGRITMLSLMDVGGLEPGVGARVTDTLFALVNMQLPA